MAFIADLRNHAPELIRLARVGLAVEQLIADGQAPRFIRNGYGITVLGGVNNEWELGRGPTLSEALVSATTGGIGG